MRKDWKGNRFGLYVTVIFHITVIVFLIANGLKATIDRSDNITIDFLSEEDSKELEELKRLEELSKKGEAAVYDQQYEQIRNMAVDESGELKDDRGTDASELYAEAERLRKELEEGKNRSVETEEDYVARPEKKTTAEKRIPNVVNKGAVTIRFSVDGRHVVRYDNPAYKCFEGGTVVIQVTVGKNGKVAKAEVIESQSSQNSCLRNAALKDALGTRFNSSTSAPEKQYGTITYNFIPQY